MHSLSRTLVLGTSLLTAVVLVAAGVVLYLLVRMSLLAELDRSLVDRAELLASTIELENGKLDLELVELDLRSFEGRHPEDYLQIWSADGTTIYKSPSLENDDLPARPASGGIAAHFDTMLPDGTRGRAMCLSFAPRMETAKPDDRFTPELPKIETVSLSLAHTTSHIDRTLARLRLFLVLVGGGAVAVSSLVLKIYVARSLRKLHGLAQEIERIGENDLNAPVVDVGYPVEIAPVVERLNQLLQRLEAAFRRERTMNANVAHELRNPLAGLRLKLDVAVSRDRESHEYRQAFEECREITSRVQRMVDNLLSMARLDAGQFDLQPDPVNLEELIRSQWGPLAAEAHSRRLQVQWALDSELTIVTDADLLGMAVRNLLDNAVTYADESGTVSVRTNSADGVHISVSNTGSRLNQEDAENAFAPFWQHDPSRSTTGVHCGLGLSLVQRIITVLQGQVSVKSNTGGEFEIDVLLPKLAEASLSPRKA